MTAKPQKLKKNVAEGVHLLRLLDVNNIVLSQVVKTSRFYTKKMWILMIENRSGLVLWALKVIGFLGRSSSGSGL